MKANFKWIYALFLVLSVQLSFAQEKTVTGTVTEAGQPLPGVTVIVKGTNVGTQTDFDGKFSIKARVGAVLEFTYIGMKTQNIAVGAANVINVTMVENVEELGAVVVQAYRTTTREKSNISQTTVTAKTIEARPNASFIQTLQGQVPGLNISTGSGQPGSNSQVILRGIGSINGKIEPLFVIDGVPLDADNFRSLNPDDIESITVLKDAGATSIYGNRGANGAIVVTTKKGSFDGSSSIKYTVNTGFTSLQNDRYNMMNAQQLLTLQNTAGTGLGSTLTSQEIAAWDINTNWKDVLFRTGVSQNHVISITNGGKNMSSFTSIGYFEQEGIVINTDLQRFNFRNNVQGKALDGKLTYGTNFTANYSKNNSAPNLGTGNVNINYVIGGLTGAPYLSPDTYQNGRQLYNLFVAEGGNLLLTPLMLLDQSRHLRFRVDEFKMIANTQASYQITNDISIGTNIGLDYTHTTANTFQSPNSFNSISFATSRNLEFGGLQSFNSTRNFGFNANTRLNYNKTFAEKHNVDVSLYTEYYKAHLLAFGTQQNGLNPKQAAPGAGTGYVPFNPATPNFYRPTTTATKVDAGLFSYFGQADYDYDAKYGFGATVRRDASYRFSSSNRWGTFWSISGRWNLHKEAFMDGSVFNVLKARASYGTAGNQNVLGESIFNAPNLVLALYGTGLGYAGGTGITPAQFENVDLRWETISQANLGVDFEVMTSRLRGSLDVYQRVTTDMYLGVPVSAVTGTYNFQANYGEMSNTGVELLLNYDVLREGDFKLSLNFNGSFNKNKIEKVNAVSGEIDNTNTLIREGSILNEWYLIPYAGVNPANGQLLFYDINGNLTENPNPDTDRRQTGKTARFPVYQGGFGFDMEYKGFYLNTLFSYVADIWRLDFDLADVQSPQLINQFNKSTDMFSAWTPDNPVTFMPALTATNADAYTSTSDRYLTDASFVRLRNIQFGYTFSKEILKSTPFKSIKAFAQAENLITWSKWRGWDAESPRFADQFQFPTPRIVSLGLELQF